MAGSRSRSRIRTAVRATLVAKPIVRGKICILKFTSKNDYDHFLVSANSKMIKKFLKSRPSICERQCDFYTRDYLEITVIFFERFEVQFRAFLYLDTRIRESK